MSGPLRAFTKLSELPIKSSLANRVPKTRRGLQDCRRASAVGNAHCERNGGWNEAWAMTPGYGLAEAFSITPLLEGHAWGHAWGTCTDLWNWTVQNWIVRDGTTQHHTALYGTAFYYKISRKFYMYCQEFWGASWSAGCGTEKAYSAKHFSVKMLSCSQYP